LARLGVRRGDGTLPPGHRRSPFPWDGIARALAMNSQLLVRVLALLLTGLAGFAVAAEATAPHLGKPLAREDAARWDLSVFPDGQGLPPGRGNATEGAALFASKCAVCHGTAGRGATAEELAGGTAPLTDKSPDKTIGLYWPYATTLFDFTRRAMPMFAPGSLSADEVYALTAYLLLANGVIAEAEEMNAASLPRVRMPNRNGFVGIDAKPR
jgi:mono/diheme cytochrome c family protein